MPTLHVPCLTCYPEKGQQKQNLIKGVVIITKLQQYFPILRERETILKEIVQKPTLLAMFESWKKEQQEEFLDFCSGTRGVKMLYDSFFKEILNPEYAPERLNRLLSVLLKMEVKILEVLPADSSTALHK